MNLIIFGATGSIGQHLVSRALANQHHVTAFSRHPQSLEVTHSNLTLFESDVYDADVVAQAIKDNAVNLTDGYTSNFPADEKHLPLSISRKNIAHFMLQQLTENTHVKQTPGLSN